jgi:enolase
MTQNYTTAHKIKNISYRQTLNSHCQWTHEFVLELSNGARGVGTSPQGETLSIYENGSESGEELVELFRKHICAEIKGRAFNQIELDHILNEAKPSYGQDNTFALSLSFFNAVCNFNRTYPYHLLRHLYHLPSAGGDLPQPLLNVLNGGRCAYTNPILSDFPEYLLVPHFQDLKELLYAFGKIKTLIAEKLNRLPRMKAGSNWVFHQKTKSNLVWIEFLLDILDQSGFNDSFGIMIDASAGDLWDKGCYRFSLTDHQSFTSAELCQYWSDLLSAYPISILEDPFSERHTAAWSRLVKKFPDRLIAGDNLCATNTDRIDRAAKKRMISAVLIKPNQAGTVSATVNALKAGLNSGLTIIPSHRSIETESTFLSDLIHACGCRYTKLGLLTDFETIIKLNTLLRYHSDKPWGREPSAGYFQKEHKRSCTTQKL